MIHLTSPDGTPIDIQRANIREVQPLGDGAIVFLNSGPPARVQQSASWIIAMWKR